jgi:hypothetical protein
MRDRALKVPLRIKNALPTISTWKFRSIGKPHVVVSVIDNVSVNLT